MSYQFLIDISMYYVFLYTETAVMDNKNINEMMETLFSIGDRDLAERFLSELMTPAEVETISSRWELLKMLSSGVSQREISKRLGISLCKITRGSRELKKESSAIKEVLERSGKIKSE